MTRLSTIRALMLPILLSLLVQPILCANDTQVECDHIWKADDKCSFAGEYCQDYAGTLFNYISLFYCTNSVLYKILLVVFYAILLFTLFLFISTSAGDFFCPNLHTIAGIFGMSENLTGVTFLAFGNGAPDLFSTFNALQQGSNSLAIGELLGAASFITTVVVGSIALRGFRANRRPFVRDILFFVAAVSLIIGVLWDGKLTLVESLLLICLYVLYVIVVVFSRWIHVRSMKISQANGHTEDNDLIEQADTLFQPNQDFEDQDPLLGNHLSKEEHEMLLNKHRFTSASSKMWYFRQKRHGHHRFKEGLSESFNLKPRLSMDSEATSNTMSSQQAKSPESAQLVDSESSIKSNKETNQDETSGIDDSNLPSADISEIPGSLLRRRTRLNSLINEQYLAERFKRLWMARPTAKQIILSLFPILEEWEDQTWIQRLISLGSIPAYVLLTLTIPVVDLEEEDDEEILRIAEDGVSFYTPSDKESWNWWFLLAQSIVSPLFFCTGFGLWNSTACVPFILTSFILPVVVAAFINPFKKPKYYKFLAFVGFPVAVLWISTMASEILSLLQSIGIILTVSDAIIGLTVFAIGNSLPDLVANISVARNGYTDMAIAACFGGPMLNMLIGIGVSSTYYNLHTGPCYISFTPTLISSAVGLFCGLLISGIYVPCNEWKGTRHYGLVLIGIYVVLMVVNIMLELFSGKR